MKLATEMVKARNGISRSLETQHPIKLMGLVLGVVFLAWALHVATNNGDEASNASSTGRVESVNKDQPAVEKDQSKTVAYIMQVTSANEGYTRFRHQRLNREKALYREIERIEREINLILSDVAHNPSANASHLNRQIEQRDYLIDMILMSAISGQ